jgi:hypothetical protein
MASIFHSSFKSGLDVGFRTIMKSFPLSPFSNVCSYTKEHGGNLFAEIPTEYIKHLQYCVNVLSDC